jgi:hexosaminidase
MNDLRLTLLVCFILLISLGCNKNPEAPALFKGHPHGIIPLPANAELNEGTLSLDRNTVLVSNPFFSRAVEITGSAFMLAFGSAPRISDSPEGSVNIRFTEDHSLDSNTYCININTGGIDISAGSPQAAFYGAQSVRQILWNAAGNSAQQTITVRNMKITDKPYYDWRGFHLDVSRHFFTKEYIFKIIDWLAYYKINKLHLHLTDDQGWRIQIDQYPQLTETGAWRVLNNYDSACIEKARSDINYNLDSRFLKEINGQTQYGGYYTRDDIREIVAYAGENFIEVIPEVDMPGHMSAAIRAYPWLSCTDSAGWGTEFSIPLCPCNEEVMNFCYQVADEIAELFPSKYIHIGCDEVEKDTWASSSECSDFMNANDISNLNGIQNFFVRKMQDHLEARGKKVIAWDDVIEGDVDNDLVIMYWRDWVKDSPSRSAMNGNEIIIAPWTPFYLASANNDEAIEKLFDFRPSEEYSPEVLSHIIGMQTCMWTEFIPSEKIFEKFAFPRLAVLSEISWSSARDWGSFKTRMKPHFSYLDAQGINYYRPSWKN